MAASVALLLGACTLEDTFANACAGVPIADAGFRIYAQHEKVSRDVKQAEKKAVAAAQAVCDGPRPKDVPSAIAAVSRAIAAIADATRKAKAQAGK